MTLKSIIKTISNDKILSILALFSVILIGTLMYYNLNEGLLNYNSRTLEYFYANDDPCIDIIELINYPDEFETYPMKDANGTEYEYLIIDKLLKHQQIMNYIKYHIKTNVNELNEKFLVNTFKDTNKEFSTIKTNITTVMNCYDSDILENIINEYETDFNDEINEYNEIIQQLNGTEGVYTPIPLYRYLTKIYKILLNIVFKYKIETFLKNLKGTNSNGLINKYMNNPTDWRKRRIRNITNALHRVNIAFEFINKDETSLKSVINYNWLPDDTSLDSDYVGETTVSMNNNANGETSLPDTNILEYNFNDDVPLSEYIVDNNTIFKNMIDKAGLMDSLKTIYNTTDFGYYHVFEYSGSIKKTYSTDDYNNCRNTIEYENGLCENCEGVLVGDEGDRTCDGEPCDDETTTATENTTNNNLNNIS